MKILFLIPLLFSVSCMAVNPPAPDVIVNLNNAVLTWERPTARADGTVLEADEIDHYEIFMGRLDDTGDAAALDAGLSNVWEFPDLAPGEWQFWMWTVDTNGTMSELSNEMRVTVEVPLSRPSATSAAANLQ